jgi:hypothetical protein
MGKFYGGIGFSVTSETKPGVYEQVIVEKPYYGDVPKKNIRYQNEQQINDELKINSQISIVCDEYLSEHFSDIRYIKWMGKPWKISSIDVDYPRLILSLGDIYTGKLAVAKKDGDSNG